MATRHMVQCSLEVQDGVSFFFKMESARPVPFLPRGHSGSAVACELLTVVCGIQFPDQGLNPGPLHWENRFLATGPPRMSHNCLHWRFNVLHQCKHLWEVEVSKIHLEIYKQQQKILKNTVQKHKSRHVKIVSTWTLDSREALLSDSVFPGLLCHFQDEIHLMSAPWLLKLHFLSDVFPYHVDWSMKIGHLVLPWKDTALSPEGLLFLSPLLMGRQTTPTSQNSGQHCPLPRKYPWVITERFTLLSGL